MRTVFVKPSRQPRPFDAGIRLAVGTWSGWRVIDHWTHRIRRLLVGTVTVGTPNPELVENSVVEESIVVIVVTENVVEEIVVDEATVVGVVRIFGR